VELYVFRNNMLEHLVIEASAAYRHTTYLMVEHPEPTMEQLRNRDLWARPS
jgi:hypothetical protein